MRLELCNQTIIPSVVAYKQITTELKKQRSSHVKQKTLKRSHIINVINCNNVEASTKGYILLFFLKLYCLYLLLLLNI